MRLAVHVDLCELLGGGTPGEILVQVGNAPGWIHAPVADVIGCEATPDEHGEDNQPAESLHGRITDQHSTAGRAPSRVRITRTVPPGRSVAVRGYPAVGWLTE